MMRSTRRSVAIGGRAEDAPPTTAPRYTPHAGAGHWRALTAREVDDLVGDVVVMSSPFTVVSLGEFRGGLRRAVHEMKFRNRRWIASRLGRHLARVASRRFAGWRPDVVTWAPTTERRLRLRGHDQSALIAAGLARSLRVPRRRTLRRSDDRAQTGAPRTRRLEGPRYVVRSRTVRGRRVLLVDDVMTTGSTLRRARDALVAAGAREVRCVVVAHVKSPAPTRIGWERSWPC